MIVMFQGTNLAHNYAIEAACVGAIMSAAKYNRKTLLLQFTGMKERSAEDVLIGKEKRENEILTETFRYTDTGIDALLRRASTSKLTKDAFDKTCSPLLKKHENMLDIAEITQQTDFEINLSVKDARTIFKHAKEVYDNVFAILDGTNTAIMQEMLELADVYVTCFPQKQAKEEFNEFTKENQRSIKVITDYENESAYSIMFLKKLYGDKKIYILPHNTKYRDNCIAGTLLNYILKNMNDTKEDDNFTFMRHVIEMMEGIMGKEDWSEEVPVYEEDEQLVDGETDALEEITDDDFGVEQVTTKKGFFRKQKTSTIIRLNEDKDEELDPEPDEELEEEVLEESLPDIEEPEEELEEVVETPKPRKRTKREEPQVQKPQDEQELPKKMGRFRKKEKAPLQSTDDMMKISPSEKTRMPKMAMPTVENAGIWICPDCGAENVKKFCAECGTPKPLPPEPEKEATWICPNCGEENVKKFCAECGTPKPDDTKWICPQCGEENEGKFCGECGFRKE